MATKRAARRREPELETSDRPPPGGAPLFEEISPEWAYIAIERLEPIEERGYLGQVPVDVTAETLRSMYGGGKFVLRAKTSDHQVKQNRTLEIAGDPVFTSDDAEARYKRRAFGARAAAPAAAPAAPQLGLGELMGVLQMMQTQNQQLLQQQLEAQREERRRQAEEDRRREEQRREEEDRREQRRREEMKADEQRRHEEAKAERDRNREHMQTMLQLVTSNAKGGDQLLPAFMQGITTALQIRGGKSAGDEDDEDEDEGGGDQDPVMATIRAGVQGLVDGIKGIGSKATETPAASSSSSEPEPVKITGPLADMVKELDAKAKAKGKNTEQLLAGAVDVLNKRLDKVKAAPAAPSSSSSSTSSSGATVTDLDAARKAAATKIQQAAEQQTKPETPAS